MATLFRSVVPALLTGNGVVLKPSEHAPRTAQWVAERFQEELPDGLFQVVIGDARHGEALIDADINACVFTGSVEAGRKVAQHCAERGIPLSSEMGGKDAAVVLRDCNPQRTVAGITHWALHNVGQSCGALEIAYVDQAIADSFVDQMADAWRRLRVGPGPHASVDISPMANAEQLGLVERQVEDARRKGARVICGGARLGTGLWYPPTLLDRCTDEMDVVRDETFGPVLAVVRVSGASDALARINRSRYGLGTSIWTADTKRAERLASRLNVGVITINNHALTGAIPQLPWSGTRDSGHGVANSKLALATYTRPQTVLLDSSDAPEVYWMPFDTDLWKLGELLADAQVNKLLQAWRIPMLLKKRAQTLRDFFRM